MKIHLMLYTFGVALLAACSSGNSGNGIEQSAINSVDKTNKPGDNFYAYATGNWIKNNPKPEFWPTWDPAVIQIDKQIEQTVEAIQKAAVSVKNVQGSVNQIMGDFYWMYMDTARLKAEGTRPIQPLLQKIASIGNRKEMVKQLAEEHCDILFSVNVAADAKDSRNNIVNVFVSHRQDAEYIYLAPDANAKRIRAAYEKMMTDAFVLCGYDAKMAADLKTRALNLLSQRAAYQIDIQSFANPVNNYHKVSLKELSARTGGFDWQQYLKDYGYDSTSVVNAMQFETLKKSCNLMMNAPLADLKALFQWMMIEENMPLLGPEMENVYKTYVNTVNNNEDKTPRWKSSYYLAQRYLPEALGHFYVKNFFPDSKREKVGEMIKYMKLALKERIGQQQWLCDSTKKLAVGKVDAIEDYVGYSGCWINYSQLSFNRNSSLFDNMRNVKKFVWEWNKQKRYNKPVDRTEWELHPHVYNAYYDPEKSSINLMAAFMQLPNFDEKAEDVYNYAALGAIIGHELTHGFDSNGRYYDKDGNNKDWWTAEDSKNFKKLCDALIAHFDSLKVYPDLKCNGKLTISENIADLAGLKVAFRALQLANADNKMSDKYGYSPEQRFFIYTAYRCAGYRNETMERMQASFNEHAVNHLRINGPLPHIDEWYKAFNVQPGDSMYIPADRRIRLW